ncbi:hypothetical protein J5295_09695 [Riemerella anatipestifer]|uniref:Uncharacterized protein n=4 Tax=Riemerella anatipestifer TaxID=34085 RepID=E4TDW9_RIEAD|nr:hypothetical protein [Riemerella anatipestifer]ADQ82978.1 hypothetical protein Riean_1825 [Riemerella anatipestifer ATCC 11845 = DSM 15868]AFD55049.1 hypothetical protein RA0C_0026 [Riemerella anatipestifer ATCC 11845 = DSM 15868]AGC41034.1 hypothetical protein G148_1730 [Riemerella anatipestifer RA-CH-2]AKP70142.1 hypothetical protein CG08_2067 [Riemerella anatipestifer]AKP72124.1 hypothetical protein CG09_2036 [Riemerella anatipestifer]
MGTKITYKSLGHDPNEDYRWVTKSLKKEGKVANSEKELKKFLKDPKNHIIQIGKKDLYAVNKLKLKNKMFLLPEGNPVTYYYSIAYDILNQIEEAKMLLLDSLEKNQSKYKWHPAVAFSFVFKVGANAIIFSFLALEAFMNQCLPDYAKIEFDGKLVDKNIIQKYSSFETKFKTIIPQVTKKDFLTEHPRKAEVIVKIKKLRDELTHLKEMRKDGFVAYEDIYNQILNVDLKKIVNTVKFYINYHSPKTIQNYRRNKKTTQQENQKKLKVISQTFGEDENGKYLKYYYEDI